MEHWIIPSNNQKFRIDAFLAKYENKVDWKQLTRISVGDVVYIYGTRPEMRIKYKMKVIAKSFPPDMVWAVQYDNTLFVRESILFPDLSQ